MKPSKHSYELSDEERVTYRKWRRHVVVFYAAVTFVLSVLATAVPSLISSHDMTVARSSPGDSEAATGPSGIGGTLSYQRVSKRPDN
jgi:hypothetical protein